MDDEDAPQTPGSRMAFPRGLAKLATSGLAAASIACAEIDQRPGTDQLVTRLDSAGIEIVVNGAVRERLGDLEVPRDSLLLDSLGEPFLFTSIPPWGARTTPNGTTIVVSPQESRAYIFDAAGRFAGRLGSRGDGPGELRLPLSVITSSDTVAIYDPQRLAVQRWSLPDRNLLPQVNIPAQQQGATLLLITGDSLLIAQSVEREDSVETRIGWSIPAPSVLDYRQPAGLVVPLPCLPFPIRRAPLLTPMVRVASYHQSVAVSGGGEYRISILSHDRLRRIVSRVVEPRPTDQRAIKLAAGRGIRGSLGDSRCEIGPDELAALIGAADIVPPISGLSLTGDGSLWVLRSLPDERPSIVDQFDSSGVYFRTLRGMALPIGALPDGRLLIPIQDEESGGLFVALVRLPQR